jgi:uncharacterized coiled-coil protein SlyX
MQLLLGHGQSWVVGQMETELSELSEQLASLQEQLASIQEVLLEDPSNEEALQVCFIAFGKA